MTKKMLIDAAHLEEVRVALLDQGRVEDFDFESQSRKPLRGNIYLARVTRVEPSLQAAFVDYGGNRHGFLAFSEIHPDYYQIPVSDRKLLQDAEAEVAALAAELEVSQRGDEHDDETDELEINDNNDDSDDVLDHDEAADPAEETATSKASASKNKSDKKHSRSTHITADENDLSGDTEISDETNEEEEEEETVKPRRNMARLFGFRRKPELKKRKQSVDNQSTASEPIVAKKIVEADNETADPNLDEKTDENNESSERAKLIERYKDAKRKRSNLLRNYKIQEVIKRRQILLIQVVKEERGNKGAALTTYMSLAGRYCVLMPNTARGGGISRKIANQSDRRRLRRCVDSLEVAQGMGLIIRTAGAKRTKTEIKRDYDYLLRLWESIRTLTLKSIAPCLIYEEASLIKRAIRDMYDKDISAVLVEGEAGYREAKDFMKMLMPSHAKNVQAYKDRSPIFLKNKVEAQLDAMYQPSVRLKSGGYVVIHQTEALVAIDVNSGRATRERNIEQTALKTNIEAATEAARQFRLRDLAGLIVIDFIDMEEPRNNRKVEKALKDALKNDRARIQVGRISNFGLLEMSRQRRRSGIIDGTTNACPTCAGAGTVRSNEIASLRILRAIEGEAVSGKVGHITAKTSIDVSLYILNHHRDWLQRIEEQNGVLIEISADSEKAGDLYELSKSGAPNKVKKIASFISADHQSSDGDELPEIADESDTAATAEPDEKPKRRRRKRNSKPSQIQNDAEPKTGDANEQGQPDSEKNTSETDDDDMKPKRRRRGRRGGRRNRREPSAEGKNSNQDEANPAVGDNENTSEQTQSAENKPTKIEKALATPSNDSVNGSSEQNAVKKPVFNETESSAQIQNSPPKGPAIDAQERKPARKGWWQRG
ncbi:MAG: ribonuclease E/G [Marinicaulis sp.]|nr:ribonuclease E/G [Marinicaulis sp.]